MGNMQCTIWETAWYIRGMENLMMDMLSDEELAEAVFDMVEKMSTDRALIYAKAGVDILYLGDDIGMQHSIMMSEEMYSQWLYPRLKRLISKVKEVRPDIIVIYHSCGYIESFINYLIDAGIDVLNPIQAECMEFREIYEKYGEQDLLPRHHRHTDSHAFRDAGRSEGKCVGKPGHCGRKGRPYGGPHPPVGAGSALGQHPGLRGGMQGVQEK